MFGADQWDERRICLLTLKGGLGGSDLVNLAERLRGLGAQGVFRVVIDMREVTHWDYRGLNCLADAVDFRKARGGLTAFIMPGPYLREIAVTAGVLDRFDVYDALNLEAWEDAGRSGGGIAPAGHGAASHALGL